VIVGDLNTPLSPINRSSKQKINKEILEPNHTIYKIDLADVYRIFHPTFAQCTAAHGTFSKTDHLLVHKARLSIYKRVEIIPCILSYHNALKLEINDKNNSRKHAKNWKLNSTLLNDQWVIDEIKEEIKSFREVKKNENMTYWNLFDTAKPVLRGKVITMNVY
jgi:hypothetical protein